MSGQRSLHRYMFTYKVSNAQGSPPYELEGRLVGKIGAGFESVAASIVSVGNLK